MKENGLAGHAIWDATRVTLVSQLQYASPAWSGFLSASECSRLQACINKAVRYGFLPTHTPSVSDPFQSADQSQFQSVIRNPLMFFNNYAHALKNSGYSLRSQSRHFMLPTISTSIAQKSSINRMLYRPKLTFTEFDNTVFFLYFYCLCMHNCTCHRPTTANSRCV